MSTPPDTTTRHEYTDEDINKAWNGVAFSPAHLSVLRAFLDALPMKSAEPGPWPGQQEVIDAAMMEASRLHPECIGSLAADPKLFAFRWPKEAPARLAVAQAYDAARPQAAEIAALRAELEQTRLGYSEMKRLHDKAQAELAESQRKLDYAEEHLGILSKTFGYEGRTWCNMVSYLSPRLQRAERDLAKAEAELAKWRSGSAAQLISSQRDRLESAERDLDKAQAELAALRQLILAGDGRSLGDVHKQAWHKERENGGTYIECDEAAAQAVVAAARPVIEAECLAQAVRRMEAVPKEEIWKIYIDDSNPLVPEALEAVRALFIAAVKGEGQAQGEAALSAIDDDGNPALASDEPSEPYHAEEMPQAKPEPATKVAPATFEAHGYTWTRHTPGDPMPCDGDAMVQCVFADGDLWPGSFPAKDVRWTKNNDLGDVIGWRYADEPAQDQQAEAQPWTPAVGDTVRLKS